MKFDKHKIAMKADQFSFQQSTSGGRRGERELGAPEMLVIVDSIAQIGANSAQLFNDKKVKLFLPDTSVKILSQRYQYTSRPYNRVKERVRSTEGSIKASLQSPKRCL